MRSEVQNISKQKYKGKSSQGKETMQGPRSGSKKKVIPAKKGQKHKNWASRSEKGVKERKGCGELSSSRKKRRAFQQEKGREARKNGRFVKQRLSGLHQLKSMILQWLLTFDSAQRRNKPVGARFGLGTDNHEKVKRQGRGLPILKTRFGLGTDDEKIKQQGRGLPIMKTKFGLGTDHDEKTKRQGRGLPILKTEGCCPTIYHKLERLHVYEDAAVREEDDMYA